MGLWARGKLPSFKKILVDKIVLLCAIEKTFEGHGFETPALDTENKNYYTRVIQ